MPLTDGDATTLGLESTRRPTGPSPDAHKPMSQSEAVEAHLFCAGVRAGGPPDRAHLTTARIGRSLEAAGYRLAGPNREISPKPLAPDRIADSVVEMAFPIEPL